MSDTSTKIEWNNFSEQSSDRDLGLQVENSIFWVSRRKLADCSSVFNTMLYGEFKESKQDIIKLSDKEPDTILELLRCIFPCKDQSEEKKPIDGENVELLLSLGDEYQITDLLDRCWEFIKLGIKATRSFSGSIGQEKAKLVMLAIQYKKKDVIRAGLRRLSELTTNDVHQTGRDVTTDQQAEIRNLNNMLNTMGANLGGGCRLVVTIRDGSKILTNQSFVDLPLNIRYAVLLIASWRSTRSTHHVFEYEGEKRDYCISHDGEKAAVYKCDVCKRIVCGCTCCANKEENQCRICHQCGTEYGKTDFICKCIDPIIEAELEKLGLM